MHREPKTVVCPDCGFSRKTRAVSRVECFRCGSFYDPGECLNVEHRERTEYNEDIGDGFVKFSRSSSDS